MKFEEIIVDGEKVKIAVDIDDKLYEEQENYYYDVWLETDSAMEYMENN